MTKFVIGIGSQRAGSTLLHKVLAECTSVYMNPVKELHYFDTLYKVRNEKVLHNFSAKQLGHEIDKIVRATDLSFVDEPYKNALRTNYLLATKKIQQIDYIDLFRPNPRHNMIGEITPEYMILPKQGIRKMRETVGDDAKIILLARNPVKRFVSAFKLLMLGLPNADTLDFEEHMSAILNNGGEWLRVQDAFNDYETALDNYRKEFEAVLMLSYDSLFSSVEETAEKLSDFLGARLALQHYKNIVGTKVNALDETKDLSANVLSLLEARYSDKQMYLDKVFGGGVCAT